jgi:hypothetical protein
MVNKSRDHSGSRPQDTSRVRPRNGEVSFSGPKNV